MVRRRHVVRAVGFLTLLISVPRARAAEADKVAWRTDVGQAWKQSREQGRPMLVFVTHSQCLYCTKMKLNTWSSPTLAGAIDRSYVPLTLDGGQPTPLLKDLAVVSYPTTFVISPQAVVLDRVEGFIAPEALSARLAALRRGPSPTGVARTP